MTPDRIRLTGLRVEARHGVLPEERRTPQPFVIDVELELPLAAAAATDDVAATVHYGELAERLAAAATADPVDLIETLADRLARAVLEDGRVHAVAVTVHKPRAPIAVAFDDVSVRIERRRAAGSGTPVVVALGANEGERAATLDGAVTALTRLDGLAVDAVSTVHETVALTPEGPDPARPAYLNQVLVGRSTGTAAELLESLHAVERVFGRVRTERWGDRTLDLDLIVFGGTVSADPYLVLPHPRAHERRFVLAPWLEVAPDAELPGRGRVADLLAALPD